MSKPSPRKQKKQKERQRQEKAKKLAADKRQLLLARKSEYAEKYPGFRFDTANGDPEFVEVVKKAVAQINFDDESVFPPEEAEIYRRMKREGANRALSILEQAMAKAKEEGTQPADAYFCVSLDQAVFDLIGEAELLKYIPFNDVRFFQVGHHILVTFDSLLRTKGSGGTVYYSRKKPTIEIDGEKKLVAFSKHAIDRMCDRIKTHWKMYEALGDLFGFLTYRNFPRKPGLTVEQSLAGLRPDCFAGIGIVIPEDLITDCVRLCCSLCLLENDPEIIAPDVLADDRAKYEQSHNEKYVDKAHRRGKVGWDVGRHVEVMPHYRRPHMTLVWTGRGRAVPRIVPRKGSVVHREVVEKVPSSLRQSPWIRVTASGRGLAFSSAERTVLDAFADLYVLPSPPTRRSCWIICPTDSISPRTLATVTWWTPSILATTRLVFSGVSLS
ncbi:MAG: hypothetical protein ACLQNE_26680 [Thermoguttaceae bacterium]